MRWLEALDRLVRPGPARSLRMYQQMRQRVLDLPGSDLPLRCAPIGDDLLAVLVEMPIDKRHRRSLVCVCDGTTSLYDSRGGETIGAGDVPSVRVIARELLEIAASVTTWDQARWAGSQSKTRNTRIDFVTTRGVLTGWSDMLHFSEESAFLRIVHVAAQKVITEIRVSQSETRPSPVR